MVWTSACTAENTSFQVLPAPKIKSPMATECLSRLVVELQNAQAVTMFSR
jgi:hypothetical protein